MKDEPSSWAQELSAPRADVQALRSLFSEGKCAPPTRSRPAVLKKPDASATPVRIPRPSLAPKPPNKPGALADSRDAPVAEDPPAVIPSLPRVGAVSAKRISLERLNAAIAHKAAELQSLRGEIASSPANKDFPEPVNNGGCKEPANNGGCKEPADNGGCKELACEADEEDYVTPISLSSQRPAGRTSPVPPVASPPEEPRAKAKPRLPEPPRDVPQQLARCPPPVVHKRPCWRRCPLPPTTTRAPPKPTRPPGMTCPFSSPPQPCNGTPPSVPGRSNGASSVGAPLQPPPPPRPAVPKPPRLLPSPPAEDDDSLYEDTPGCSSPIPEYTEDEELGHGGGDQEELYQEELYQDTALLEGAEEEEERPPALPPYRGAPPEPPPPRLPARKEPPPAVDPELEELYEEMPSGDHELRAPPLPPLPPPSTNRALNSLPRRGERRDYDQLGKKFGLPAGWQQRPPVDAGRARDNSGAGCPQGLELRRGEPLYVLRVENNPPGKWLVRNRLGEVGYADLANIEVDAESIKFIMTSQGSPFMFSKVQQENMVQNDDDDEEAIYEETG